MSIVQELKVNRGLGIPRFAAIMTEAAGVHRVCWTPGDALERLRWIIRAIFTPYKTRSLADRTMQLDLVRSNIQTRRHGVGSLRRKC
jgi:hypothetical protein